MKKKIEIFMIVLMLLVTSFVPIDVKAASKSSLRAKIKSVTSEKICKIYYKDFNGDGKKEAIGITSNYPDEEGFGYAKVWYVTDRVCKKFAETNGEIYTSSIQFFKLKGTIMFSYCDGGGGPAWGAYGYTFQGDTVLSVKNIGYGAPDYLGNNKFVIYDSQYDASKDGSGHTWNKYYSKWDGKKLVEYGGLKITQAQLKKAKNGAKILRQIKKQGKVGNIYYRANGMVFVNYTTEDANFNVALKLKNGTLTYYYKDDAYGTTKLEKATNGGIIYKALTNCVKYPKKFPVK